jgi:nicotinamidase-related amidase
MDTISEEDMESIGPRAALIIIDVQEGLDDPVWGQRNNPDAEENMARLLAAWRRTGRPLFHIQHDSRNPHSPLRPGLPGNEIKALVRPREGEPLIRKSVNSAFIGTDLEKRLHDLDISTVVVVGLTTSHCVETTARVAGNLGFETYFVSDATATFGLTGPDGRRHTPDDVHSMTLANIDGEFATVITTDAVLEQAGVGS